MITLQRLTMPALNAMLITSILLYLMVSLISSDEPELRAERIFKLPAMQHVIEEENVTRIKPTPAIQPKPKPPVENTVVDYVPTAIAGPDWVDPIITREEKGEFKFGDNQLILAVSYPPSYPQNLVQRGIEGYAVVGFSVDAKGAVFNAFIIESEPGTSFDRAALTSIKRFKYKPRMVNGKTVATEGQRYMFSYQIDE